MKLKHASALLALAVALSGCTLSKVEAVSVGKCLIPNAPVSVVYGARAGMPSPTLTTGMAEAIAFSYMSGHSLYLTDSGSSPRTHDLPAAEEFRNSNSRTIAGKQAVGAVLRAIVKPANSPESDLLAAIDQASRTLSTAKNGGTVIVIDSGLSTSGELDMARLPAILTTPVSDLVQQLSKSGRLPVLDGRTVIFSGLGDTASPQAALPIAPRKQLVQLWVSIAKAAGASCVQVDETPLTGPSVTGALTVSAVDIPVQEPLALAKPITFNGEQLRFRSNSADFVDLSEARAQLASLALDLATVDFQVAVIGTTAFDGTASGRAALSRQRADAVKGLLVELGVSAERLVTLGVGCKFAGYVSDRSGDGVLIESRAQKNRNVIIGRASSVQELTTGGGCSE